jgi:hypothetical protein
MFYAVESRETYREGLLNIPAQSLRSVLAAGCNRELCLRMVMLIFSPARANLLGSRREGKCKVSNGELSAANGFRCRSKCEY